MKSWNDFISGITDKEFFQMIEENKNLEADGFIGDCLLRTKAEEWISIIGVRVGVVLSMRSLVYEGYKRFAEKYFETGEII